MILGSPFSFPAAKPAPLFHNMGRLSMLLAVCACALLLYSSVASAAVVNYTFRIGNYTVAPLCQNQTIVAVNNQLPGPLINVTEGDTVIVDAINESPYNVTLHWHGLFQRFSPWADGPAYVTQCPIMPGNRYTYRFNVTGQEGTLWWHAHFSMLRATVYGGLVIRPRGRNVFPFVRPDREIPIIIGEWWNDNVVEVEDAFLATGLGPEESNAYTINGLAGRRFNCSSGTFSMTVVPGQTYLLRIINAAINNQHFFRVAGHNLTVVAADAAYTDPYNTDVVAIAPGQTVDVLLRANQSPGVYFMAAHPYFSTTAVANPNNSTATAIIRYSNAPNPNAEPVMPALPDFYDTNTAHRFYTALTSLSRGRKVYPRVPYRIDQRMFVTFGLNISPCQPGESCPNLNNSRLRASMNNVSFQAPTRLSMLEAHFNNVSGIYTDDFPDNPETLFDFTNNAVAQNFLPAQRGTRVKRLPFGTTVEMVLQNTAVVSAENHPMHLHGFNFYVVGQGFGNFNRTVEEPRFNLVNPQERNTIAVPVGGWAVIRFFANNPGVWLMHCHLDVHVPWGLQAVFVIDDGPAPTQRLVAPPADLPRC